MTHDYRRNQAMGGEITAHRLLGNLQRNIVKGIYSLSPNLLYIFLHVPPSPHLFLYSIPKIFLSFSFNPISSPLSSTPKVFFRLWQTHCTVFNHRHSFPCRVSSYIDIGLFWTQLLASPMWLFLLCASPFCDFVLVVGLLLSLMCLLLVIFTLASISYHILCVFLHVFFFHDHKPCMVFIYLFIYSSLCAFYFSAK